METYSDQENDWQWTSRASGYTKSGRLELSWEIFDDPISDSYSSRDIDAASLLKIWMKRLPDAATEELFGPGSIGISWFLDGEFAPFQMRYIGGDQEDFLTHHSWPRNALTGERVNFNRLPVTDKLWREGRGDKGGFVQEATGWKPSALTPVMWLGAALGAAALTDSLWLPRGGRPLREPR